jgi:hypothetical protein
LDLDLGKERQKERQKERKTYLQEKRKKNILDTHWPSHGRS